MDTEDTYVLQSAPNADVEMTPHCPILSRAKGKSPMAVGEHSSTDYRIREVESAKYALGSYEDNVTKTDVFATCGTESDEDMNPSFDEHSLESEIGTSMQIETASTTVKNDIQSHKTKLHLAENTQHLHKRATHLASARKKSLHKEQLKQYSSNHKLLQHQAEQQQFMLENYANEIRLLREQVLSERAYATEQLNAAQLHFLAREKNVVEDANARFRELEISVARQNQERENEFEFLKQEISSLKVTGPDFSSMSSNEGSVNESREKRYHSQPNYQAGQEHQKSGYSGNGSFQAESPVIPSTLPDSRETQFRPSYQSDLGRMRRVPVSSGRTILRATKSKRTDANIIDVDEIMGENSPTCTQSQKEVPIDSGLSAEAFQLLSSVKEMMSKFIPVPTQHEKRIKFGRRKAKATEIIEDEIKSQDREERQKYLAICRGISGKVFGIMQDEEILSHTPPSPEEIRQKFERRKRIVEQTILYKHEVGDRDIEIWEWLLEVLEKLTLDGMSSEESEDPSSLQVVYRVKLLPWRRNIEEELKIIDSERRTEQAGFSKKGSVPVVRIRSENNPTSRRKPVSDLPRCFYSDEWFNSVPQSVREKTVSVSKEQFVWLELWAARHEC